MTTFDDDLRKLEADYKAKAEHYDSIGDRYLSAVYWGCYTGVFYAGCAYISRKLDDVRKTDPPFDRPPGQKTPSFEDGFPLPPEKQDGASHDEG